MDMTTKVLGCMAVLLAIILTGCGSSPVGAWSDDGDYLPQRAGPGLVAMEQSPIPDVPMPIGFKPLRSQCSSSFDGVARTVTHVYQGRAKTSETVQFYRQQLPLFNWERVDNQVHEDGSVSMYFNKGAESLGLRLSGKRSTATIEVYIAPR